MQKTKVMCLILAMVLASAGTAGILMDISGETVMPSIPDNAVNAVWDRPEDGVFVDGDAIKNLFIAQGELQRKGGFVGTTRGTSVSAGITQDVFNNRVVIGNNVFKEMKTIGIVKNAYQLYIYGDSYIHRKFTSIKDAENVEWANTAVRYNEEQFVTMFGHRSNALTGYILNEETVLSGNLESAENGLYTYRYVLDIEKAPARLLYEMRTNSNLNGFATFVKAEIVVTMDGDWQVKTLRTDCKYKVPMMGVGFDCVEDVTETFSDLTSDDLPEKAFFEQFLNADISSPVEDEPDALSVLMDIFGPYIGGGKLNLSFDAAMNGQKITDGAISAKIDIENLSNIEVSAKIGNDLYIEYGGEKLYVTYQDFKGSTTVQGMTEVFSAFMPKGSADLLGAINTDEILANIKYSITDNVCTVNIPLNLGDVYIDVNIFADVVEGGYKFSGAAVQAGEFKLSLKPASEFAAPDHTDGYEEILGLLDLVQNGIIYGSIDAFGMQADVMFDLSTMSLYATGGDIELVYTDNNVYVTFGAVKLKLDIGDVDYVMALLKYAGIVDGNAEIEMPQISAEQVLALLADITATKTDNGVRFDLGFGDISAALYLVTAENGWNIDRVEVNFNGNNITLASKAPFAEEIPAVNADAYTDVTELLDTFVPPLALLTKADGYGADFNFNLVINGEKYDVEGMFRMDAEGGVKIFANAYKGSVKLLKADVTVVNNVVYLDINGVKTAFKTDGNNLFADIDLKQTISELSGVNQCADGIIEAVLNVIDKIKNIDLTKVDYANLIKEFNFANGELNVTVNAGVIGLGDVGLTLSSNKQGDLIVGVNGLTLDCMQINAHAAIFANAEKVAEPNAEDYVLNLEGTVQDVKFAVSADLLNTDISVMAEAFGQTLQMRYVNDRIYAKIDNLAICTTKDKIGLLINRIMTEMGLSLPNVDMDIFANADLSVKDILSSLKFDLSSAAFSINLVIKDFASIKVNFDNEANLADINVTVSGYSAAVRPSETEIVKLDTNAKYFDLENIVDEVAAEIKSLINADGYRVLLEGTFAFGSNVYGVIADVNYNGGLYVSAQVSYNKLSMLNLELWYVQNTVYARIGDLKFAFNVGSINQNTDGNKLELDSLKGYNDDLDGILSAAENIINKISQGNIDVAELLKGIDYDGNSFDIALDGTQLGLSNDIRIGLQLNNGVALQVSGLTMGGLTAEFKADVSASGKAVTAPNGDFTTNIAVKLDELNTIYASLDLLNGVYNLKLDDLYIQYANNVIKVNKGDMFVSGDLDRIVDMVKKIDDLVNEFSGAADIVDKIDLSLFDNIDLRAITKSIAISVLGDGVHVYCSALGFDIDAAFIGGELSKITVPVSLINKTLEITPCGTQQYVEFTDEYNYIAIDSVLEDYYPVIEKLVHTNSWKFSFDGDTLINLGDVQYMLANGSYFEFYYKNTEGMDTFKLRAKLDVRKLKADNTWQEFMSLDIVYKDGSIYVTDTGRNVDGNRNTIRLTVSVDTIKQCFNLYDDLVDVIPQIGEMVQDFKDAMAEAENNAELSNIANILKHISYQDNVFGLKLDGKVLLSKLGEIFVAIQPYGDGLSLDNLTLFYDNISIQISNMRVEASAVAQDGQYAAVQDILSYDYDAYHIDFNSLYDLLSALVVTARPTTEDGSRSFDISGNIEVNLLGVKLNIGVQFYVDIDADGETAIALKLIRNKLSALDIKNIALADYGGNSYLYFNSRTGLITIYRDSYQKFKTGVFTSVIELDTVHNGAPSFIAENITTEDFAKDTMTMVNYILEMVNFKSWINDEIRGAITKERNNDYGIEDILKDYFYAEQTFNLKADLAPIDSALGAVELNVLHNANDYSLTNLKGTIKLISICTANVDLAVNAPVYGVATQYEAQHAIW